MNQFSNKPQMRDNNGETTIKRYVHSPLTIDHNGIKAAIQSNGKVVISGRPVKNAETGDIEYDEVEIPASLIFKLGGLLRATRQITYVAVHEVEKTAPIED